MRMVMEMKRQVISPKELHGQYVQEEGIKKHGMMTIFPLMKQRV